MGDTTTEVDAAAFHYYQVGGDYYRAMDAGGLGCVEFWDGDEWRVSMFTDRLALLDDMLGGGGTVREVLDTKELPDVQ